MTLEQRSATRRFGAATVEFALVAPVLFVTLFAAIEFSRACTLRNTVKIAAAEGARSGVVPGATAEECRQRALDELSILGVRGATVLVTPATLDRGDPDVTVDVNVPVATNGYIFARFFLGKSMETSVTLRREAP